MIDLLGRLFGFRFDFPEFILGLGLGFVGYMASRRLGPVAGWALRTVRSQVGRVEGTLSAGATDQFRQQTMAQARSHHAARALFGLEAVLLAPHVLAPTPDPTESEAPREDTLAVLPNLPDWSVLSPIYRAPTIPLTQILASGLNVCLTGPLGAGKSTALAYTVLKVGTHSADLGAASELTPLWAHAADLPGELLGNNDPFEALLEALAHHSQSANAQRISTYVRGLLGQRKGLLLLDGLDELTAEELPVVLDWLARWQAAFPGNRVIAAGPARGYGGLLRAGLTPVSLAPWTEHDHRLFLSRWAAAWSRFVVPQLSGPRPDELDPAMVNGWLIGTARGQTPLEIILRTWSAYAGDVRGAGPLHGFQAYLQRILSSEERQQAQAIALGWVRGRQAPVTDKTARKTSPVPDLVEAGILVRRGGDRVGFQLPAVGAFLAAQAMSEAGLPAEALNPAWLPAHTALGYFAAMGDVTAVVKLWWQAGDERLEEGLLLSARWLRDAPRKADWRNEVLRGLGKILHDPSRAYGLRLRVVHALVRAAEPSVGLLFRRLLPSEATTSRILAALGCGGLRDEEAVDPLLRMAQSDKEMLCRQSACLALASIGTTAAMEGLGRLLLQGDEPIRMAVAEALACNPDDGYGMLKDAVEVDNQTTRRAAVFGLARVPEDWVLPILDKMQLEDKQWVVRGAAAEAAERRRKPRYAVRPAVQEPSQLPWLVAFAAREGVGVAPGRGALEMLRRALTNGTEEEKAAALEAIGWVGGEMFVPDLDRSLRGEDVRLRDAAFEALWRLRASEPLRPRERAAAP